ncbi:hypothetical protein QE152_g20731 [Popillia japonica]|uniref:Uncharacterized protein n=1 Tax=Popillia japonica TaxID=7064 RepID=A0AAW1KP08_POPJA
MVVHIAYQNVNGLRTKVEEFRNGVINHHAKIICLTETNLIPDIYDAEIFPHGYSVFRRDRVSSCKKNGVLVAVDDSFKSCARSDLACEGSEDLWVHHVGLVVAGQPFVAEDVHHPAVEFTCGVAVASSLQVNRRAVLDFKRTDYVRLKKLLALVDWHSELACDGVDAAVAGVGGLA